MLNFLTNVHKKIELFHKCARLCTEEDFKHNSSTFSMRENIYVDFDNRLYLLSRFKKYMKRYRIVLYRIRWGIVDFFLPMKS